MDKTLHIAFSRFGTVDDVKLQSPRCNNNNSYIHVIIIIIINYNNSEAFVTFETPDIAKTVQKEVSTQ